MLAFANGPGRSLVFNPDTSGLVSIEQITTLLYYGGNAWDNPVAVTGDGSLGRLSAGLYSPTGTIITLGKLGRP